MHKVTPPRNYRTTFSKIKSVSVKQEKQVRPTYWVISTFSKIKPVSANQKKEVRPTYWVISTFSKIKPVSANQKKEVLPTYWVISTLKSVDSNGLSDNPPYTSKSADKFYSTPVKEIKTCSG